MEIITTGNLLGVQRVLLRGTQGKASPSQVRAQGKSAVHPKLSFFGNKLLKMIMRIIILLYCTMVLGFTPNNVLSQTSKIKIEKDNILSVDEVFDLIMDHTQYKFFYEEGIFDHLPKVRVKKGLVKVSKLLRQSLSETDFNAIVTVNDGILIMKKSEEQHSVTGKVEDESGMPMAGVVVLVKGTTIGTETDFYGNYSIKAPSADNVLVFSFLGFETQEMAIGGQSVIDVVLKEDIALLEEVVITGYQEIKANETTSAHTTVKEEQLDRKIRTNITDKLEGLIPGLVLTPNQEEEGARKLDIRGTSSVTGNITPLIVVDGFPLVGDLSTINPNDVETITVLKDASAASIYGVRSSNGVIVITTRKGASGKFRVDYNSTIAFTRTPNLSYNLQRATTNDLIDLHRDAFVPQPDFIDSNFNVDKIFDALNRLDEGLITQAQADNIINGLRGVDNLSQLQEELVKTSVEHQQDISISGGSDKNSYRVSLNHVNIRPNTPTESSKRTILDFRNNLTVSDKVRLDISGNIALFNSEGNIIDRSELLDLPAYNLLKDGNGNPLAVELGSGGSAGSISTGGKSPFEIQRLVDLGLLDETYIPLQDFKERTLTGRSLNVRLQALLNFDLFKDLRGNIGFQYERGSLKDTRFASADSREMRNIINNAANNPFTGTPEDYNIPIGGSIAETRGDRESYTFRGQLNYTGSFANSDHVVNSIVGFELRSIFSSGNLVTRYGYDPQSLNFQSINAVGLRNGLPTQGPSGFTVFDVNGEGFNNFTEVEDRFVSAYGNASYTYKHRYTASGSIRVDQSNLFGTDPEFRYRPLWSAGLAWNVSNESFFDIGFIDDLKLRYSYGINGNIANLQGPFTIAERDFSFRTGSLSNTVISPPNDELRWEKTTTSNIGLDLSVFDRRFNITLDYYRRNSKDLLSNVQTDPTLGFAALTLNQANIVNNGLEVGINARIIKSTHFQWATNLNFRSNDNEVKKVFIPNASATNRVVAPVIVEGFPANSLFSYRFDGLDDQGRATALKADGTSITDFREAELEDLVHSGTVDPTFSGGVTNNFNYGNFELSLFFIFSGGHVMINDTYGGIYTPTPSTYHSDVAQRWRQPGDEATTNIPAAGSAPQNIPRLFTRADINVLDADYVKLRELIFTYNFNERILSKTPFESLGLKFQADNLFYWARNDEGIDPEAHGLGLRFFSIEPTFTLGLRASF